MLCASVQAMSSALEVLTDSQPRVLQPAGTSVVLSVAKTHPSFNVGNQTPVIHLPLLRRVEDVDYIPQDEEAEKLAREKVRTFNTRRTVPMP